MVRPTLEEICLEMAELVSKRSTCLRLQVGTVLTTVDLLRVIGYGYNGNYRGGPNTCDRDEPGNCGDIHAEVNALVKADTTTSFYCFCTHAPCVNCAKLLINAGCKKVYYRNIYRSTEGVELLEKVGIEVEQL